VLLRVLVGADGDPRDIVVKASSGFERLDRAAQETVRRWRFVPARMGTVAVDAWVIVPIVFALTR
jgi:protein TonB